jgi:mannose-6-phosphate isomerase-like protein (cupin superfamily)
MSAELMRAGILRCDEALEYLTPEGCYILELSNSVGDPALSIARARVAVGVTTRWHRLHGVAERYVMLSGRGRVEVGDLAPVDVAAGDVVRIPPNCRQRITNRGDDELIFLAICSPRYTDAAYEDLGDD